MAQDSTEKGELAVAIKQSLRSHNNCSDRKGRPRLARDATAIATAKSSPLMEAHALALAHDPSTGAVGTGKANRCVYPLAE